jgi:hypothetical protein
MPIVTAYEQIPAEWQAAWDGICSRLMAEAERRGGYG